MEIELAFFCESIYLGICPPNVISVTLIIYVYVT